ncbi:MAG: hypothetical protein ACI9HK_004323, partial [Pirellulaceae bacterium]
MSFDTNNELETMDNVPEVSDVELNPAIADLLDAVRQQQENSAAGFRALRDAIT